MKSKIDVGTQNYEVGQKIFEARTKAGLSQMELADEAVDPQS